MYFSTPTQVAIKDGENLDQADTITFPISGKKDDREYQNSHKFMPLISSPGVAFIVVNDPPGTSANAVFNSVLSGWPVLLLTLLMALLSGIIMWGLVSKICDDDDDDDDDNDNYSWAIVACSET